MTTVGPSAVMLQPGVPHTLTPQAVSGRSLATFSNDNTVAGGLNAAAAGTAVHLTWEATQDGVNWYEIASCTMHGEAGVVATGADNCSLSVSTMPSEQQVRLTAFQPSAVAGSVVLSPTVSAVAVSA